MKYKEMLDKVYEKIKKGEIKDRINIIKPEISSSGNKTIISNFEQFCNSIRRDKKQVAKFLYKELATSGFVDRGRLILQTRSPILEDKIQKYLKNFVYCHECGKPDTILQKEGRFYILKCEACGARRTIKL
ncbi:MAG: translation initiation factor IF-2 subunit beta [Candidatus Aenigmatarchaeota archaeon]|nr:MAG: translation initiation factor IF-2 subunit beta [Candidatus Aenigmarchaeota archaeon]